MGLCKCRQVTNLFCFEHRKNVCLNCLEDHPKCCVKSYLSWLQDSDYSLDCTVCSLPLSQKECLRLECLDVFHLDCIKANNYRKCPLCNALIQKTGSVVGKRLMEQFKNEPWFHSNNDEQFIKPRVEIEERSSFLGREQSLQIDPDDQQYKDGNMESRRNYYYYCVLVAVIIVILLMMLY